MWMIAGETSLPWLLSDSWDPDLRMFRYFHPKGVPFFHTRDSIHRVPESSQFTQVNP